DLPPEAHLEKKEWQAENIQSLLSVPMVYSGELVGLIGFDMVETAWAWSSEDITLLQLLGDIIVQALQRKRTEEELISALNHAIEANKLKTELLARVSHELRTPLNAIVGYTTMLQERVYGPLADAQMQTMNRVLVNADKLNQHINSLLDQAQIEAGQLKLNISQFSPTDLIDNAQSVFGLSAKTKGLALKSTVAPTMPSQVWGDLQRIQDIIINLVGNAIKFTDEGYIEIIIYPIDNAQWVLQVSDTGIGIPKEAQDHIFDSFRQVDGSMTRIHGGVGLGLAIVKRLTRLMGGDIHLDSDLNQGSIFTVTLPVHPQGEIA
ncbi:MAG: ATP-binding protein, partial [Chloroflexota bacterium]